MASLRPQNPGAISGPRAPAAPETSSADPWNRPEEQGDVSRGACSQLHLYHWLFECITDGALVTDLAGVICQTNAAAAALLRIPREFLIGKPLAFLVAREDWQPFFNNLTRLQHQRVSFASWEVRLQPRKAGPMTVLMSVTLVTGIPDQADQLLWLVRDLSNVKRAEESFLAQKELGDSLLDLAEAFVLLLDADGRILRANPFLEEITGFPPPDLVGRTWYSVLMAERDRTRAKQEFLRTLVTGQNTRMIYDLPARDGQLRTVAWSCKLLRLRAVAPVVLALGHDITDLQRAQEQNVQLERLAAIGQMATGLAHESRNALQRGQACLEMLRLKLQDRPEVLDWVSRAQKAQDDLLHLYEDVREYAAPIRLDCRPVHLAEVWREVWDQLLSLNPGREACLKEDVGGVDLRCAADRFRMGQVFRNLLENSLAACPRPARVAIRCRQTVRDGGPALQIAVHDNGPGFSPEQRRRLFEPFFTTKIKGTGLGLAISRRIIEAHDGALEAGPGPGAEILITLPYQEGRGPNAEDVPPAGTSPT